MHASAVQYIFELFAYVQSTDRTNDNDRNRIYKSPVRVAHLSDGIYVKKLTSTVIFVRNTARFDIRS